MRINQIQNLCWAANVLVFAGMGFAGYEFYGAWKSKREVSTVEWPADETRAPDVSAWPPAKAQFVHLWKTWVNGEVPPPPEVKVDKQPDVDAWTAFKGKLKYIGGLEMASDPSRSSVFVEYADKKRTVRPGQMLGEWQVTGYVYRPHAGDKPDADVISFTHVETGREELFVHEHPKKDIEKSGPLRMHQPEYNDPVSQGLVGENDIPSWAFKPPGKDTYYIPSVEIHWWRSFGEKGFTEARATARTDTAPRGVLFGRPLHAHRALKVPHGVGTGDLVSAVDGNPITDPTELLRYFQGWVPGVEQFVLTIEKDGVKRDQRYRLCFHERDRRTYETP